MAKKKYDISDLDSLKQAFNDSVQELAEEVVFDTQLIYEHAIDMFYKDYTPLWYRRTYSTFAASSGANGVFTPHNIRNMGAYWETNITIDSNNIVGHPYRADTDWVFTRTFLKGIHGINSRANFGKKRNRQYKRGVGKRALQVIKMKSIRGKDGQYYLRFMPKQSYNMYNSYVNTVMNNMSPAPVGIMSSGFKELTLKRNLRQRFNDILSSKF